MYMSWESPKTSQQCYRKKDIGLPGLLMKDRLIVTAKAQVDFLPTWAFVVYMGLFYAPKGDILDTWKTT